MKRAQSKYPVGAKWVASNRVGKLEIWLEKREENIEVWRWSFSYPDGSYGSGDWETSYALCYQACYWKLYIAHEKLPRFKRVRE